MAYDTLLAAKVENQCLEDNCDLAAWVRLGIAFTQSLPPKQVYDEK